MCMVSHGVTIPLYLQGLPFTMGLSFLLSCKPAYIDAGEQIKQRLFFLALNHIMSKKRPRP